VVMCHTLVRQKSSCLLVSDRKIALNIMKYATHARICRDLRDVFGDVRLVDGGADEFTNVEVTGDQTGTVWSLPDCPQLKSIEDVSDSILAAFVAKIRSVASNMNAFGCVSSYKLAGPRV
jgi:hypothetical protein